MNKKLLTEKVRLGVIFILRHSWKITGWKFFVLMKVWDFVWKMFIYPFLSREEAKFHMKRKIKERQKLWSAVCQTESKDDVVHIMRVLWHKQEYLN